MHIYITLQNKNHMGLKCYDMIKSFMQVKPLLRPLVLILKILIEVYDISYPYKSGLSSYAITLMVIALLQVIININFSLRKPRRKNHNM